MTSLEHEEGSRGNESVSDYDYNNWEENDNWGDMETGGQMASSSGSGCATGTSDPTSPPSGSGPATKVTDGWDNEEWGSLDEEPEAEAELTSPSEAWSPSETAAIIPMDAKSQANTQARNRSPQSNWDDRDFEPLEEHHGMTNSKLEEAKKKRDERKLMRQKELEARRNSRTVGGPMKLGAKKL